MARVLGGAWGKNWRLGACGNLAEETRWLCYGADSSELRARGVCSNRGCTFGELIMGELIVDYGLGPLGWQCCDSDGVSDGRHGITRRWRTWRSKRSAATIASPSVVAHAERCGSGADAFARPPFRNTSPARTYLRQLAARFRCARRNDRSIEVALPGFEVVVDLWIALECTKAGKSGERQAIAERLMAERLLGLAATTPETRFLGRAAGRAAAGRRRAESRGAESQATESRAVLRRVGESCASASDGSCATNLAMAGRTSASTAAARAAVRFVEGASAALKLGRSSESMERELAAEASCGFLRARSHWASRACTSASTHSSKISLSSLRRLATVFRRLRWNDSMEASDEVKRYSRGRSMASSRDAEGCFASPLELGIASIDITRVITSYSTEVAVLVRRGGGRAVVGTNAEMGLVGRRFTEKVGGRGGRLAFSGV